MATLVDLQKAEEPRDMVHRAVQALAEGHVIAVPTETVYGLAASGLDADAVSRLVALKGRNQTDPLALALRSSDAVWDFACQLSPLAQRLARRCWPGPLTLVLPCDSPESALTQLPEGVRKYVLAPDGCVGFRVVAHRVFETLHQFVAAPIVLTSANVSGQPPATNADAVLTQFADDLPLILSDGPSRYAGASTVVRVRGNEYEILREGAIERAALRQFVKPIVAVVCTGNTCRSPMAEVMLRERFRQKTGREDAVLVVSAGVSAMPGGGAAQQAVEAMSERGLDLTGHSSRPLDERLVELADLILTMTNQHREAIITRWPAAAGRVHTLMRDGGDVSDPIGAPPEVYLACADQIDQELAAWVEELGDDWLTSEISSQHDNQPNGDDQEGK